MKIGLNKEEYKLWIRDIIGTNSVVVGGACKNNCIFCSCRAQKAAGLKNWTNYISMEDLESGIDFIKKSKKIYFGEGLSFLSCEPFQHPNYLDLLERLNYYFPNTIKRTTSICKNINPESYQRIKNSKLQIIAGINTLDREKRLKLMRSEDDYYGVIDFLKECVDNIWKVSFLYTGDLDILKRDLEKLYKISNKYIDKIIMLRLVDYSKFHNKETEKLHAYSKETWHDAIRCFDKNVKNPRYWIRSLTDFPDGAREIDTYEFLSNIHIARKCFEISINNAMKYINENLINIDEVGFLLPESTYYYFLREYPGLNAIEVKNLTFGGSYTVAPLLTKNDLLNAVLHNKKYNLYVTSTETFPSHNYYKDIMGNSVFLDIPFDLILS